MKQKYDYSVVIGRFEPAHYGHKFLIDQALHLADKTIVVIGSANQAPNIKNPFTDREREAFIRFYFTREQNDRLHFVFVEDRNHQNALWISDVYEAVNKKIARTSGWFDKGPSVTLVGHKKDETSWYLDCFKQWEFNETGELAAQQGLEILHSTDIRELIFRGKVSYIKNAVHDDVFDYIKDEWLNTSRAKAMIKEYNDALEYEKNFSSIPEAWARNFVTADAVIVQSGHVLLVKRGVNPGKGLWALPGGHVNANELVLDAAIREANEETNIKVQEKVLRGSLREVKLFEDPNRSLRCRISNKNGRTYTFAHFFWLADDKDLPRVKGGDDAELAWWVPIGEAMTMRNQMFEDHYDILNYFIHSHDAF